MPKSMQTDSFVTNFYTQHPDKSADSETLLNAIIEGLLEKKAQYIQLLDVRGLTTLTDFFVVCHGTSDTQIRAIANSVTGKVKEEIGENVWQQEGMDIKRWVILDYVNVVVHIFSKEKREFYGIERMWNDAKITRVEDS